MDLLPGPIWQYIGTFLNLRDQCKLASTCKALWMLPLDRVRLLRAAGSPAGISSLHEVM